MIRFFLMVALVLSSAAVNAQNYKLSFSPKKIIKAITFKADKGPDGRNIAIFDIAKEVDPNYKLESDSVVLTGSSNQIVLNHVFRSDIDFEKGIQSMATSYFLTPEQLEFLKSQNIIKIGLTVNGQLREYKLRDSSQEGVAAAFKFY